MYQDLFFKHSRPTLAFLLLLLLLVGPAQSGWCFQYSDDTAVPDTLIKSCNLIPTNCLSSTSTAIDQNDSADPFGCEECFDVSFEEVASSWLKNCTSDIDFSPAIAFFQPKSINTLEAAAYYSLSPFVERPVKEPLNIHSSIKSTVIII